MRSLITEIFVRHCFARYSAKEARDKRSHVLHFHYSWFLITHVNREK